MPPFAIFIGKDWNFLSNNIVQIILSPQDFCCLTTSATKEEAIMYPSEATAINRKRIIYDQSDADELIQELKSINVFEQVLITHNDVRTPGNDAIINSKIRIREFLNLYCSIFLINHEIVK